MIFDLLVKLSEIIINFLFTFIFLICKPEVIFYLTFNVVEYINCDRIRESVKV